MSLLNNKIDFADFARPKAARDPLAKFFLVSGFTLIELMITISIAAILLALAVPSFSALLKNNRLTAQTNSFKGALQYARATALSQNTTIQVCPIGVVGSTACGTSWAVGWMVTIPGATLLQSNKSGARDPALASAVTSVSFTSRGLAGAQTAFTVCDSRGSAFARAIQVETTGSIQTASTPGQTLGGAAVSCP